MLSLDECRMALGSLADDKSDDQVARMRDHAAAVARIVIRTSGLRAPCRRPTPILGHQRSPRIRSPSGTTEDDPTGTMDDLVVAPYDESRSAE